MRHEFSNVADFVTEAFKRGMQIFPQKPDLHDFIIEGFGQILTVGIRQFNPNPNPKETDNTHYDMIFGEFFLLAQEGKAWIAKGYIFDTDDEYDDWKNDSTT
jgi:hypothetical protein